MKFIRKGAAPPELPNWTAKANENWQPSYDALRGAEKAAVKSALMKEQGHICCYCERELLEADSHIEHLIPQSADSVDALDFGNMLCSCQSNLKPGVPRHCGMLKDDWYEKALFVSPLDPACESRFAFLHNGKIKPAEKSDQGACESIKRLGLGIPKLNDMRKSVIDGFLDGALTQEDSFRFVEGYLQLNADGKFPPFVTTIRILFG